jgi:hypothetical protein
MSERPRVTVEVLPSDVGAHVGLLGAFAIAGFPDDTPGIVYLDSPDAGETTKHPATVAKIDLTYDCVEAGVAELGRVLVRDTTNREGGTLSIPAEAWRTFMDDLK